MTEFNYLAWRRREARRERVSKMVVVVFVLLLTAAAILLSFSKASEEKDKQAFIESLRHQMMVQIIIRSHTCLLNGRTPVGDICI